MIFVTGGTGLLGSNLLVELANTSDEITAIYRDKSKIARVETLFEKLDAQHGKTNFKKINWVYCDVLDVVSLEEAMQNAEYVFHCAALVSFRRRDFPQMMKINRRGTFNIVNLCLDLKVKKLIYVSSTAAVGKDQIGEKSLVVETNKWVQSPQTSGYSISKYSAEKEVWRGVEEGLNAVIINPSVIFGPGSWSESSLTIFRTLASGLKFYTKGANAFVDVRDVVKAMLLLKDSDISGQNYLCTGTNISFRDLFRLISKKLAVKEPTIFANRFMCEIAWRLASLLALFGKKATLTKESVQSSQAIVIYDSSKIKSALNFDFHSIEDTIDYTIKNKL
jgi:dihydroflavonol-4-reductase